MGIRPTRDAAAFLPSELPEGELFWAIDQKSLYVGNGSKVSLSLVGSDLSGFLYVGSPASTTLSSGAFFVTGRITGVNVNRVASTQITGISGYAESTVASTEAVAGGLFVGICHTNTGAVNQETFGVQAAALLDATNITNRPIGVDVSVSLLGATYGLVNGTINDGFGIVIESPLVDSGCAITTLAGLDIEDQAAVGVGTSYGILIQSQSAGYAIYTTNGKFHIGALGVHANNAAAIIAGLVAGDLYRNGADPDLVCVVH